MQINGFLRFLAAVSAVAVTSAALAQPRVPGQLPSYLGWMPMQPVTAGGQLVLDLHRFYFAQPGGGEELVVPRSDPARFTALFDKASQTLRVRIGKDASGLIEIPLRVLVRGRTEVSELGRKDTSKSGDSRGEVGQPLLEGVLLLGVQPADGYTFTYRPNRPGPQRVSVAGQFNDWNPESHPLRPNGEGVYEIFVRLPPGSHPYKLVIDGELLPDPANPEKLDDGTGNENSVARVEGIDRGQPPVVYAAATGGGKAVFRIVGGGSDITQVSAVVQMPDGTSRIAAHELSDGVVTISTGDWPEGAWLRVVAADAKGNVSNAARAPVKVPETLQWQDGIIYYAFTDRFANGDESNDRPVEDKRVLPPANYQGGDFQGIRQKIDEGYFKKLGVNVLWLAPVKRHPDGAWQEHCEPYRFSTGYHGNWPVSHTEVEPRFGGESALGEMVSTAHSNGMLVIADLVLKHVHTDHPIWKQRPELFGPLEMPDGSKNLRRWDEYQSSTWFEEWLPGFDFDNPEAVKFLIRHAVDFANRFKLDGFRVEVAKHIKHSFWWRYRTALRNAVDPGREIPFYSLGETFLNREGIMSFVGPNMLDGQFDYPLYDTIIDVFAKQSAGMEELERSLSASESIYGKETLMSPLLGNQDKARFMAYADGDLPDPEISDEKEVGWAKPPKVDNPMAYAKLKLGLTFILSIDGVPMIYYGDEIGMSGAGDPDNRRMLPEDNNLSAEEMSVRAHFSKVAAVRHKHPALRYGSRRALVAEGDRYAFVRAHLGDTVLAVWNRGDHPTSFALEPGPEMPDGLYRDALSGQVLEVIAGRATFEMEPMKSALFVAQQE